MLLGNSSIFTTGLIGVNARVANHIDRNNIQGSFSSTIYTGKSKYGGCYLKPTLGKCFIVLICSKVYIFCSKGIYFPASRGSIVLDRSSLRYKKMGMHCNTVFQLDSTDPDAARNVLVLYTHPLLDYIE